jgi:hypothetical protein
MLGEQSHVVTMRSRSSSTMSPVWISPSTTRSTIVSASSA